MLLRGYLLVYLLIISVVPVWHMALKGYMRLGGLTLFFLAVYWLAKRQDANKPGIEYGAVQPFLVGALFLFFMVEAGLAQVSDGNGVWALSHTLAVAGAIFIAAKNAPRLQWHPWDFSSGLALLFVLVLFGGARMIFKQALPYGTLLGIVLAYGLLRFVILRRHDVLWDATDRRFLRGIGWICLLALGLGGAKVGAAVYKYQASAEALEREEYGTAAEYLAAAEALNQALGIEQLAQDIVYQRFGLLFKQGMQTAAAGVVGLDENLAMEIAADAWEGPSGGALYKNISCWRDLTLVGGRVEITVFARGQEALEEWPLMQVALNGRVLGQVEVRTSQWQPYVFEVQVDKGVQRLELSFLNDINNNEIDRNLWVGRTTIAYKALVWN